MTLPTPPGITGTVTPPVTTPHQIRILIVDDAALIRRFLSDGLGAEPSFVVAGTAADGRLALSRIPVLKPDIVTLDVEMPTMDGLATLIEIRARFPDLPVIMVSSLTSGGAKTTIEALERGARDVVCKPIAGTDPQIMVRELISKIKGIVRRPVPPVHAPFPSAPNSGEITAQAPSGRIRALSGAFATRIDLVVIGISTGGPSALARVIPRLPADVPVPIVLVQHMPPVFTQQLAERLSGRSAVKVTETFHGAILGPNQVWIAKGGQHVTVVRKNRILTLEQNDEPSEHGCRPAVDQLFRSVANLMGANVLGVVLTGMGEDGKTGSSAIRQAGGQVFAQDEASSVVWGMPGAVAKAGLADKLVPIDAVAGEILTRLRVGRTGYMGHPRDAAT